MFTNISWATYLITVAITIALWYTLIGLTIYYQDIKDFLAGKRRLLPEPFWDDPINSEGSPVQFDTLDNVTAKGVFDEAAFSDFEVIENLVDRSKSLIEEAVEKSMPKQDFYSQLTKILKEYPILSKSQFRPSVNEFIVSECDLKGYPAITMEEADALWQL